MSPLSPVSPPRAACSRSRGGGRSRRPLYVLFCVKYKGGSAFIGSDRVPAALQVFSTLYETAGSFTVSQCRQSKAIHNHGTLNSSSKRPSHQDFLLYTQFSRTHLSFISSSIHCGVHLSLYLNISM
jgi:hypothetical protein